MADEKTSSLVAALKLDENPLNNQFMYIEEHSCSDGSFIVSSIIKNQIERDHNIILVLCHNSLGHFHAIGQKLGYNLMSLKTSGRVFIIDILEDITNEKFFNIKEPLRKLYCELKSQFDLWKSAKGISIILENIGNLLLLDMKELFTFVNCTRMMTFEHENCNVVCLFHTFPDSKNFNILTKSIRHFADITVILKDLQTGRANDVTGNLTIKRRQKNFTKSTSEYQYQLQDKSVMVFAPGTRNFV